MADEPYDWSQGYLYVIGESGEELPGSRRYLTGVKTAKEYQRIRYMMESQCGEDCTVLDSEEERELNDPFGRNVLGVVAALLFFGFLIVPFAVHVLA